jgi:transcriptional regulator with XRE-family HTH domain
MMPVMTDARAKITRLRRERDWTLERLAREADLTTTTVWRIESGATDPTVPSLEKLARAFGITVSELLEADDGEDPTSAVADTV